MSPEKAGSVRSFDVFDTLITRVHASPDDVHWHVAELSVEQGLITDQKQFVVARREAERLAWARGASSQAIQIESIYLIVSELLAWPSDQATAVMQIEIRLESESVRVIPDTVARLESARTDGSKVCFISDMHLREHHLRATLQRLQIIRPDERLIVSSEHGVSKRAGGRLFRQALNMMEVSARQVRHLGDDPRSDRTMARRHLIRSEQYNRAHLNRYEEATLSVLPSNDWRMRSIASVSKLTRLQRPSATGRSETWDLLCSTIAPFVCAYAMWVLNQARARGARTLFFMARDMQIVHEVATALASASSSDIECKYIHASRASWQPAAFSLDAGFDTFWLTDQLKSNDPRIVLKRLFDDEDIQSFDNSSLLSGFGATDAASSVSRLFGSEVFKRAAVSQATRRRDLLLNYLTQQGFSPDSRCALVDAGWRGTLQKCLSRAYSAASEDPSIEAYYIGLRHRMESEPKNRLSAFLSDDVVNELGYSLVTLIEGFLTANHGTTLGYVKTGSALVEPLLATSPSSDLQAQWKLVRDSCVSYVLEFIKSPAWQSDPTRLIRSMSLPLLQLCKEPRKSDAKALSGWVFDAGRETSHMKHLISEVGIVDMAKLILSKVNQRPESEIYLSGTWLRGSIAATILPLRGIGEFLLKRNPAHKNENLFNEFGKIDAAAVGRTKSINVGD